MSLVWSQLCGNSSCNTFPFSLVGSRQVYFTSGYGCMPHFHISGLYTQKRQKYCAHLSDTQATFQWLNSPLLFWFLNIFLS